MSSTILTLLSSSPSSVLVVCSTHLLTALLLEFCTSHYISLSSQMDFATTSARPRSFSWNSEKCWNKPATKTPASATLSASVITRPVSLSLGSSPQSKAKSNQKQPSRLSAVTLQLSPQIFMSGYLHRKTQSGKWQR